MFSDLDSESMAVLASQAGGKMPTYSARGRRAQAALQAQDAQVLGVVLAERVGPGRGWRRAPRPGGQVEVVGRRGHAAAAASMGSHGSFGRASVG
jgi:hypothetical protein